MAILLESRATAIIVTHDPQEALLVADRIVLMNGGRLVQIGSGESLYRRPGSLFAARFFCELNELPATVHGGRVATPFGSFPADGLEEGAGALVCVRPWDVRLAGSGEGVPGRILSQRFAGEDDALEIGVAALARPLIVRLRRADRRQDRQSGRQRDVRVTILPEDVLVFAARET
jgi:iron(III) transport system ATP-binding protein